ncbi:MAG: hypothetical protein Q4G22_04765 [Paracoccus sp. (in: a-proteobacteria)]|uniref:hypothetical protein n=1 Tax=Paracoccus sp. TaxID=267 RepID=UPI0026DF2748|nr:hypothetical protein [Paracoccus sp. (in: a-proteobacteria)]MDO5631131.1 hypothetical protein [Paracoccus sp. (in: a-proteobacteria)]
MARTPRKPAAQPDSAADLAAAAATLSIMDGSDVADLADDLREIVAAVVVVSAPAGRRRRVGRAFDTVPTRIPVGDLSAFELAALQNDPALKISFEPLTEDEAAALATVNEFSVVE